MCVCMHVRVAIQQFSTDIKYTVWLNPFILKFTTQILLITTEILLITSYSYAARSGDREIIDRQFEQ